MKSGLVLEAQGGDDRLESAAALDADLLSGDPGAVARLVPREIEGVLREGTRIAVEQGVHVEEVGRSVPEDDERKKVMKATRHMSFRLERVLMVSRTKLKPPLESTISTMVMAPMRKNRVPAASPRWCSMTSAM